MYYLWAVLLIVANSTAWCGNLFSLPGNWIVVLLTALFAFVWRADPDYGIAWLTVGILIVLAALGELVEFVAGAAGAGRRGGSRRGMVLAIVGGVVGSIAGAFLTLPVPLLGPILGALGGGALGAFVGAYLGETWKGRAWQESLDIGHAAFMGRLLGTIGKMVIGGVMVVIAALDAIL